MPKKLNEDNLKDINGGIEYPHYKDYEYEYIIKFKNILNGAEDYNSNSGDYDTVLEKYNADKALLLSYPDIEIIYDSGIYKKQIR